MLEDGIRHGTTEAWRLWVGGLLTGAGAVLAFQGATAVIGSLLSAAGALADHLGWLPW